MYNISYGEQDSVQQLFPTTIWLNYLDIDLKKLEDLSTWARMQPWLNVGNSHAYTTRGGDQLIPDKPIWEYETAPAISEIMPKIKSAANEWMRAYSNQPLIHADPKFAHFVLYDEGGHQWPHFHKSCWTAILGLRNNGVLLLQDPRPIAVTQGHMLLKEIIINPGQLLITPGYLIHSTAPANRERDILVFMGE
jgi:hypothetical protein